MGRECPYLHLCHSAVYVHPIRVFRVKRTQVQIRESLSPVPSPNGEGSENHYLQIKRASLQCKEGLSSIGRKALLHLRRAFPSFCPFAITIRDTMFLWLKNMSLKQYVVVSLCLKHLVLSTLILCYYVFKSMSLK